MGEYLQPLSKAFWLTVMEDLVGGEEETLLWLDTGHETGGFLSWCEMTEKDAPSWRGYLLRLWELRSTERGKAALRRVRREMN